MLWGTNILSVIDSRLDDDDDDDDWCFYDHSVHEVG